MFEEEEKLATQKTVRKFAICIDVGEWSAVCAADTGTHILLECVKQNVGILDLRRRTSV